MRRQQKINEVFFKKICSKACVGQWALLPNCGTRKTLHLIQPQLEKMGIACGRGRFFQILGYDISGALKLMGCLRAIKMALKIRPKGPPEGFTIHHSDRGGQYCSKLYTEFSIQNHVQISTAQTGNCYQNALTERVNSILETEFELGH